MELPLTSNDLNRYPLLPQVAQIMQTHHLSAYLVGGAVRDLLLGRDAIVDLDFTVPGDGLAAARRVADALGAAFYALDAERGVGRVVCEGPHSTYLDFAAMRGGTLQADLADRDFTINAMALALTDPPQLIDPLHGQRDLANAQIRAVSAASFQNDPARVLRAIRQAAEFNFTLEAQTQHLLSQAAPNLNTISPERQRDELVKLLNTPAPDQAVRMLRQLDVLPYLLSEVAALAGVDQSPPHHLDVFDHTVAALRAWSHMRQADWANLPAGIQAVVRPYLAEVLAGNITRQELLPLALLLHDTGKPLTRTETDGSDRPQIRFLGHDQASAKITRQVMRRFRFSSQAATFVSTVVGQHMRPLLLAREGQASRRAMYRFFRDTAGGGVEAGVAVVLHALADHQATYAPGQGQAETEAITAVAQHLMTAYFEQRDQVVDPPPLLTGHDLMTEFGLSEGRLIGALLSRLKEAQATGQVRSRTEALVFVKADSDAAKHNEEK